LDNSSEDDVVGYESDENDLFWEQDDRSSNPINPTSVKKVKWDSAQSTNMAWIFYGGRLT